MTFRLKDIVPWGRSFAEYVDMFALSESDLDKRIIGCGDGPAGFNAELTGRGGSVVSIDPLYAFSADDIRNRIDATFNTILEQTRENMHEFLWSRIRSVEELGQIRSSAMQEFLVDYPIGRPEGRYLAESLPGLSFMDDEFELALCSHFLFLYSEHLDLKFHLESLKELCRLSADVRVFPLLQLGSAPSPYVQPVIDQFRYEGYNVEQIQVAYEFQRGGNKMLRISMT